MAIAPPRPRGSQDTKPTPLRKMKLPRADRITITIFTILLTLGSLAILYPIVYIISASISDPQAVADGRVWLWPVNFSLDGYRALFEYQSIPRSILNTLLYVIGSTVVGVVCTILAAYPLSRPDLPFKGVFLVIFLIPMFFSGGIIASYLVFNQLNIINTIWVMILPGAVSVFNVIIARTFFRVSIPDTLHEAAKIDGASDFKFLWRVVLPMAKPIIAVTALLFAVGAWNNYFSALIYLNDENLYPLQLVMRQILILNQVDPGQIADTSLLAQREALRNQLKFALIVITIVPPLAIYPFAAKHFKQGIQLGALKG